jgi:outer membrane protein TolC
LTLQPLVSPAQSTDRKRGSPRKGWFALALGLALFCGCLPTTHEIAHQIILPEQRSIHPTDPSKLEAAKIPDTPPPRTVSNPRPDTPTWELSLNEAIRIALENTEVVRILAGVTAVSSGSTIYDVAITNTTIDQEQGRFDPIASHSSRWTRTEIPFAGFDPLDPGRTLILGSTTDDYRSDVGLDKTNVLGGLWGLNWSENPTRFGGDSFSILNPQNRSAVELSYTQPLLQGAGYRVNTAPIVIARLNTDRSFFQYKASVQEMVRGVIEAYWNLVQARTDVWARRIQVQQSKEAFERAQARLKAGLGARADEAQARVTYNQFRASLIDARANVLAREGALRNLLGLPPEDGRQIVPVSVPRSARVPLDWEKLKQLAERYRPDLIELKLILEADQVRLLQAKNQALPGLDLVALYRWNGLSGEAPNGDHIRGGGPFTDWSLGVNFSVPLGLRQARAQVRQQKLLLALDRANLQQGLHAAIHDLTLNVRDLDTAYERYLAFRETRKAAYDNLLAQIASYRTGNVILLNVLVAINDWGNAVSSEAQALLTYNVALAALEAQTGTILDTHGLVFYEERHKAAGPLGILGHGRFYPSATVPVGEPTQYPATEEPSENAFDLKTPELSRQREPEQLPPPRPVEPPGEVQLLDPKPLARNGR